MKSFWKAHEENLILILLTLGGTLLHIAFNGQYGFHRDELDILMNSRQLDWGYVAYPPFTPFMARIGLVLFGNSLRGLRLFSAISQGVAMLLAGLMARDMGGRRGAQIMATVVVFIAPVALFAGAVIQYMAFDYLWWVVVAFFFVRLLATDEPRYWLGIGAGIGLGMMTKYTIAFFGVGLVVAVLLGPARKFLRSKWLWLGVGLALLIYLPNLIWQFQHDFVSLDFLSAIHARDIGWGRTDEFLSDQLYTTTNPFSLPLWIAGLGACLFSVKMKRFRALAWMYLASFTLLLVNQARGYYPAPSYVMLLAAGCVWFEDWLVTRGEKVRRAAGGLLWGLQGIGALVGIVLMKPIVPVNSAMWEITSGVNEDVTEMIGWQDLTAQVAEIYAAIPDSEKQHTVILAGNYGEAGAFDLYGEEYGLPPVISGSNSLWYRGYGQPEPETVILVGFTTADAQRIFSKCESAGTVTNQYGVKNEETTWHTGLYVCRQPRQSWDLMWRYMQWYQ